MANIHSVKEGLELLPFDITKAPGLAGAITEDINKQAIREQNRLSVLAALHIISAMCAPWGKTPRGMKMNLITVGIAPTGSGKDIGQQYIKKALSVNKVMVNGRIPSMQSIGKTLLENNGVAVYVIDEAHGFFDGMVNDRAPQYQREVGSEMLSVYSDRLKMFSVVDARGVKEDAEKEKLRIMKELRDEGVPEGSPEVDNRLRDVIKRIEMVEMGITDPFFSLAAYSTPAKLEKIFCEENMESGLAGRVIFVRAPDERASSEFADGYTLNIDNAITMQLHKLKSSGSFRTKWADKQARDYAQKIHGAFETIINDQAIGSVATRGFELVEKVASVLAAGDGFAVTKEHLSWAFQFVVESITDTWSSYRVNDASGSDGWDARWQELVDRVIRALANTSAEKPTTLSAITQRVFRGKKQRLSKLAQAAYPADVAKGQREIVLMGIEAMLHYGVINKDGQRIYLWKPELVDTIVPLQRFIDMYNNVGRFGMLMR